MGGSIHTLENSFNIIIRDLAITIQWNEYRTKGTLLGQGKNTILNVSCLSRINHSNTSNYNRLMRQAKSIRLARASLSIIPWSKFFLASSCALFLTPIYIQVLLLLYCLLLLLRIRHLLLKSICWVYLSVLIVNDSALLPYQSKIWQEYRIKWVLSYFCICDKESTFLGFVMNRKCNMEVKSESRYSNITL